MKQLKLCSSEVVHKDKTLDKVIEQLEQKSGDTIATHDTLGSVIIGDSMSVTEEGVINVDVPDATEDTKGIAKLYAAVQENKTDGAPSSDAVYNAIKGLEKFAGIYKASTDLPTEGITEGYWAAVLGENGFPAEVYRYNGTTWEDAEETWEPDSAATAAVEQAKDEAIAEIEEAIAGIDVTYETISGDDVQLKNGVGDLLMPKTDAGNVTYDNSHSALTATNVNDAIDKLNDNAYGQGNLLLADLFTDCEKTQSNGSISTGSNKWYVNSDYYGYWFRIDAFQGDELTIKTSVNGVNTIAFTTVIETANSSAMDYAQGTGYITIDSNTTRRLAVPSDAKYLYVMTYANGVDRTPQVLSIYRNDETTLNSLELRKDITSDINIEVSGFYGSSTGAWVDSANWSSSDLFPTNGIEMLYVSSAINTSVLQVAFFNAVGQIMVSSSIAGNGDISAATPNVVKIPNGAMFAVVSGYTATSIPISVSAVYEKPTYIEDIEERVDYIEDEYINITANNQGFFLVSTQEWTSSSNWASSRMICVDGYDYVKNISYVNYKSFSIIFFDAKGKFVSGISGLTSSVAEETHETIIPSNAKYVVITGYTLNGETISAQMYRKNAEVETPISSMKKITLVIIYGQSLSVGADSDPISTSPKYENLKMCNTGVLSRVSSASITSLVPIVEETNETPATGTGEMFMEAIQRENAFGTYQTLWNVHDIVFACCGVGSATIDDLTATTNYQYVENIITSVKGICDANGYTLDIPAWCWAQGEQDTKNSMSSSDYKTKLLALHNKFCNSVATITGITSRPKCIIYQPSCQNLFDPTAEYNYSYDHMGVPTAFMELLRDNNEFIASSPTYIFDPSNSGGVWVHLNEQSYKLLGAYQGYALKRLIVDGERNQGVVPLSITVDDNEIKIKYSVPCPPLRFDTDYVNAAPNMGFNVIKSDNTELISSVSIFNDTVTIVCSSSPVGAKLRYGMNGTYHEFISGSYHYYSGAGREIGARGNLRDNQGCYVVKDIQGYKYPLYNWAYTFEVVLS